MTKKKDIAGDLTKGWPANEAENNANTLAHNQIQVRAKQHGQDISAPLHQAVHAANKVALNKPPSAVVDRLYQKDFWDSIATATGLKKDPGLKKNLPLAQAPALHSDVNGFMTGLKSLPKGSPARGKLITQHMNHAPFLTALNAHPQGKQIHAMLTTHLNSQANAGFKPGAAVAAVKSEPKWDDLLKSWPKSPADNQDKINDHMVLQDKIQESGKVMPHTNAKMSVQGEKIKFKGRNVFGGLELNPGYAEAQGSNSKQRQSVPEERHGTIEPSERSGDTNSFWEDTSADVGLQPQFGVGQRGVNENKNNKAREANKNVFKNPAGYEDIFAHLTGIKKA